MKGLWRGYMYEGAMEVERLWRGYAGATEGPWRGYEAVMEGL